MILPALVLPTPTLPTIYDTKDLRLVEQRFRIERSEGQQIKRNMMVVVG